MECPYKIKRVCAVYFSATGTTKKVVTTIADALMSRIDPPIVSGKFDFTFPIAREESLEFSENDILVFGLPVYAGRLPNLMLDYIKTIKGNGALAVPIVLFGNRAFDDGLMELRDILEAGGFRIIAAGAFVGEHSFSSKIATGRPNEDDLWFAQDFGSMVAGKMKDKMKDKIVEKVEIPGASLPYRGYYKPINALGVQIDIRRVKPTTSDKCDNCGKCVGLCPMGAIDSKNPKIISGICIKCCACLKCCQKKAKSFTDSGYLYHVEDLVKSLSLVDSKNEIFW